MQAMLLGLRLEILRDCYNTRVEF